MEKGKSWKYLKTFNDESENPAATNDPSLDIDEQFNLEKEKDGNKQ